MPKINWSTPKPLKMENVRRPLFTARNITALIVSPPLGAGIYSLIYAAALCLRTAINEGFPSILEAIGTLLMYSLFYGFFGVIVGGLLAYIGMIITGMPTILALRYIRLENKITYVLLGGIGGTILPPIKRNWTVFGESYVIHNVVAGALVMLIYFLIVNPARSTPHPS